MASGTGGTNGLFVYSPTSAFPTQGFNNTNYGVDIVYTATPPPVISGVAVSANTSSGVTVAWNTDTAADTQVEYGTTAGYGSATLLDSTPLTTHQLAPSVLAPGTFYHYRILGRSATTGFLFVSADATFTTSTATCPCSIWASAAAPSTALANDTTAVEVGVKFRSYTSGYISGIRFYKGSANTGTHLDSLWSRTGTLLASPTFSGETATGWQQVTFTSPVVVLTGRSTVSNSYALKSEYLPE